MAKDAPAGVLAAWAPRLEAAGASFTISAPGVPDLRIGPEPESAHVHFRDEVGLAALARGDHLGLAEAYLQGHVDVEGDWSRVIPVTDVIALDESPWQRLRLGLDLLLRGRKRVNRESIAFHYDRPPEFFLPWFERWRSYSHGLWETPRDDHADAQARKLQRAIDALGLRPGMRVLDMGCGWGSFVEYAGERGIRVEAITISREQHRFVESLIRERSLPCAVDLVDFFAFAPKEPLDGAVFMGTLEHVADTDAVTSFLARHLRPGARAWFDFCARRDVFRGGRFMKKWIWPGSAVYVDPAGLVRSLQRRGFNVHEMTDDTLSYAWTVRDWAERFEHARKDLAARFGEPSVRAFGLFLWGSWRFLVRNETQAYHLVAGREARERAGTSGRIGT